MKLPKLTLKKTWRINWEDNLSELFRKIPIKRKEIKKMGNWSITVIGKGIHHNVDDDKDADKMFTKFVEALRETGQEIDYASFTYGAHEVYQDFEVQKGEKKS